MRRERDKWPRVGERTPLDHPSPSPGQYYNPWTEEERKGRQHEIPVRRAWPAREDNH